MMRALKMRGGGRTSLVALLAAIGGAALACDVSPTPGRVVPGGDPARGVVALRAHGCGGCHVIPGLAEARGTVGPPLGGLVTRTHIAGRLTNTPLNIVAWIRSPRAVDPGTLMPDLGVSAGEARDIAAYLYSIGPHPEESPPRWPPVSGDAEFRQRR
jgi:cytochrome c